MIRLSLVFAAVLFGACKVQSPLELCQEACRGGGYSFHQGFWGDVDCVCKASSGPEKQK